MPEPRRIVVFATEMVSARLREHGACRALEERACVQFVLLDGPNWKSRTGTATSDDLPVGLEETIAHASTADRPVMVALCVSNQPGDTARFVDRLRDLGRLISTFMQADRAPLAMNALVVVAPTGLSRSDRDALLLLEQNRPTKPDVSIEPLYCALPARIPIYIATGDSRVDPSGRRWSSDAVWPVTVARLLGSLAIEPKRTHGFRAWRAYTIATGTNDADAIDLAAGTLVREILAPRQEVGTRESIAKREAFIVRPQLGVESPPSDRVSSDGCPMHRLDRVENQGAPHPAVPSFWNLAPAESETAVGENGESVAHTRERLHYANPSAWQERKTDRGVQFVRDRFERIREGLSTFSGPRSILSRAWRLLHDSPNHLHWFAHGGFYRGRSEHEFQLLSSQMLKWRQLDALDKAAIAACDTARGQAAELDIARSHFVGVTWRAFCIACPALYACAAMGILTASLPSKWTLYVGAISALAAVLAGAIVFWCEWSAGNRGRKLLERSNHQAESAISEAFLARVELGADGELLQRSTAWLQSAARVRDCARRVLDTQLLVLRTATTRRERLAIDALTDTCRAFQEATTTRGGTSMPAEAVVARIREEDPRRIEMRREEFNEWWTRTISAIDPTCVGGIVSARLREPLLAEIERLRREFTAELGVRLEQLAREEELTALEATVRNSLGTGTDLTMLSVPTFRARGNDLRRVTFVCSGNSAIRSALARAVNAAAMGEHCAIELDAATEDWSGSGLIVDEVSVSFRATETDAAAAITFDEGLLVIAHGDKT